MHPRLIDALRALESAGVGHRPVGSTSGPERPVEVSVQTVGASAQALVRILAACAFVKVSANPATGHLFVAYDPETDRWLRLRIRPEEPSRFGRGLRPDVVGPGIVVALMGPDGAGKSTLSASLAGSFALPVRRFYAGLYPAGRRRYRIRGLGFVALLLRLWRMTLSAAYHRRRGRVVLFDRHAFDALLAQPAPGSRRSRLRRAVLARSSPTPDLVVVLDAPTSTLRSRREDHPQERVEAHRRFYAELARTVPHGVVVDASADADTVRRRVTALIWRRLIERRSGVGD